MANMSLSGGGRLSKAEIEKEGREQYRHVFERAVHKGATRFDADQAASKHAERYVADVSKAQGY